MRQERVCSLIQRKLAEIIQREIRDPRLGLVTIQEVDVSKDLSHAKVYFTVLAGDTDLATHTLNHAATYLRTALARTLDVRVIPELHFVYDASLEYGRKMSDLIKKANFSSGNPDTHE
jgi:ribosome-binding factor A